MPQADEPVYYSDGVDHVRRSSPRELFLITIEAMPEPDSHDYGIVGGAFVNCWVDAEDLRSAERRSVALILENLWRPHRFEGWQPVTRATNDTGEVADADSELREIMEQAFVDGEVCVFKTWPAGGPDASGNV